MSTNKIHGKDRDKFLDRNGPNESAAPDVKDAVDKKHIQGTDIYSASQISNDSSVPVADVKDALETLKDIKYNNITIVPIDGGQYCGVNLGVPAYDTIFDVLTKRNFADFSSSSVMTAGTLTTQVVDSTRLFYKIGTILATGKCISNTTTTVNVRSDFQLPVPTGSIVYNITKNSWSYITSYIDSKTANIVNISGPAGFSINDIVEFRTQPTTFSIRNITRGTWQAVTNYNYANPTVLIHAGVIGQSIGDSYYLTLGQ